MDKDASLLLNPLNLGQIVNNSNPKVLTFVEIAGSHYSLVNGVIIFTNTQDSQLFVRFHDHVNIFSSVRLDSSPTLLIKRWLLMRKMGMKISSALFQTSIMSLCLTSNVWLSYQLKPSVKTKKFWQHISHSLADQHRNTIQREHRYIQVKTYNYIFLKRATSKCST